MSSNAEQLDVREPSLQVGMAAVLAGLGLAAWNPWTSDDAFISFRYAQNLVEGHGLVYNIGERVEGYTNLLWTLWIAVGLAVGVDPVSWSAAWGIVSYAAVLVVLFAFHIELRRRLSVVRWTLPLACLIAALQPEFNVFATSGLETSAFTATALAGYWTLAVGFTGGKTRPLLAGTLFGIATLFRPDAAVFAFVAFLAFLGFAARRRARFRDAVLFAIPIGVFLAGTTTFRLLYYGEFFPNTYYAKSANLAWHRQGLVYLWLYLHKYWELFLGPFIVFGLWWRERRRSANAPAPWGFVEVHAVLATAFAAAYTYYVVRVGGDFMYGRLLVPVTPYLALLLELGLYQLSLVRPVVYAELTLSVLALPLVTPRPVTGTDWIHGIADEHAVYDQGRTFRDDEKAKVLEAFFHDLPVRMAFLGTEARVMYNGRIPVAIEADTGLTDHTVARQPLAKRGRVGHEKRARLEYLIGQRQAHFMIVHPGPEVLGLSDYIPLSKVQFGPMKAWVLTWDSPLMAALRKRGAVFVDFETYLDRYLATLDTRSTETIARDYGKFRHFYFDHAKDRRRQAAFERRIALP